MYDQVFIGRKVVLKLRYVSSSVHCKESCFKVAVCITKSSLQGKLFERCGMYHPVFFARKVVLKLRYVSSSVHCKLFKSCGIYYQVFIARKVLLKLRYILSSVHCKESCFKAAVCIIKSSLQGMLF